MLAASIDVIGIPKRVLTSPDLAAYVMAEGDDGEEGGRAEARTPLQRFSRLLSLCVLLFCLPRCCVGVDEKTTTGKVAEARISELGGCLGACNYVITLSLPLIRGDTALSS